MKIEAADAGDRWWIQLGLVPALYYAGAKASLAFAVMPEVLVMLWVPNSILLAALLHYRGRRYLSFAALVILAEIGADLPAFSLVESVLFGAINLLEVSTAYLLLRRWRFDPWFRKPGDIVSFVIAGPMISAFAAACAAAGVYSRFRGIETSFAEVVRVWWFSDGLGLLILTPLVLGFWPPIAGERLERPRLRWWDGVAAAAGLILIIAFTFSHQRTFAGVTIRGFLLMMPVLYVAARFSTRTAAAFVAALAAIILYVTKNGQQPFGDVSVRETVRSAQELIFTMSTSSLAIAALLTQLRASARELEMRVKARTAELNDANERLARLAVTDALTGLLNRRALEDVLRREMEREKRHPHGLAVIIFDIDHFKDVNDRYGHSTGDAVLRHVAAVAGGQVRISDVVARYGGEEFVVVAPETDEASAVQLAERIRGAIRASESRLNHEVVRVTASFGVAMLAPEDQAPEDVFRRADRALYAAKGAGRDRVVADCRVAAIA